MRSTAGLGATSKRRRASCRRFSAHWPAASPRWITSLPGERVRRRVRAYDAQPRSAQDLLLERAADSVERIARGVAGEEYVSWPALVGAAAVVVGAVVITACLRRRGLAQATS